MQLDTVRFGEVELDDSLIINLPEGLLGFESFHKFIIITVEKYKPFLWLQSVDDGALCFVMVDPWIFFPDYSPLLSSQDVELLKIDDPGDGVMYTLISFDKDIKNMKFNLLAPLCINHDKNLARQVILSDSGYSVSRELSTGIIKTTQSQGEPAHKSSDPSHMVSMK